MTPFNHHNIGWGLYYARLYDEVAERRKHAADKRGGVAEKLPLEEDILIVSHDKSAELIALDDALDTLAALDEQKAKIVELRYFGGLSIEETAEMAKAWLYSELANN